MNNDKTNEINYKNLFLCKDKLHKEEKEEKKEEKKSIYRFNFSEDFIEELSNFSKIHQFDDRHVFKEAWKIWMNENEDLVNKEKEYLENLHYNGDILDKMFKSARYYFRKKNFMREEHPIEKKKYTPINKVFLKKMDDFIKLNKQIKPSDCFILFCKEYDTDMNIEINILLETGNYDSIEIKKKMVKTFNNRYYKIISIL